MKKITLVDIISTNFKWPNEPFEFDVYLYDIPETVAQVIRGLPIQCFSVKVHRSLYNDRAKLESVASYKNIRIVWYGSSY